MRAPPPKPPSDLPETAELHALVATIDSGSLIRGAAALGIPRATLGRRLARLEERLGVRLLRRTTRSLVLTDAGAGFLRHARLVLAALADPRAALQTDDAPRGDLRVSIPMSLPPSFNRLVCDFAARWPEVRVHVHMSNAYVDLRRDGYDVALRTGVELEPGLVARTLMRDRRMAVAAPTYLEAHGTPRTRADLKRHQCLLGFAGGDIAQTHWPTGRGQVHVSGAFASNCAPLLREAALRGLGIAQLSYLAVAADLHAGTLVHVLPGLCDAEIKGVLVYAERELVPPQVRLFADGVVAWAEAEIEALGATPVRARRRPGATTPPSR